MANGLIADISSYQNPTIGPSYWPWSSAGDGVSRLICKASEGVGFKDKNFEGYWQQATAAGAGMIVPYHYARPDLNPNAANEANWFASVIGNRLRPGDRVMLDLEQNESWQWARDFALALPHQLGKPVIYDSLSHVQQFFQQSILATLYDLALAAWHPIAQGVPAAPWPWDNILWWQYTDRETVPGIGVCDANLWLGGATVVPSGPFYKVTAGQNGVPASGNGIAAAMGLTWQDILAIPGQNPALVNYDPTGPYLAGPGSFGQWILLPGFPPPAAPATAKLVIDSDSIRAVIA